MPIDLTKEEIQLIIQLLENTPIKGVESIKQVLMLFNKLNVAFKEERK